jgi:hypothetical protein
MSRFDQEWALVPQGARVAAVVVSAAVALLLAGIFLMPVLAERDANAALFLLPFYLLTLLGPAFLGVWILLVGYVWGDAKRRGMSHVLWTLLAIFIPNLIGVILYFILRDPVPVPCPTCGGSVRKGFAFCAACGTAVRPACAQCRQPLEPGWRVCARCGTPVGAAPSPTTVA